MRGDGVQPSLGMSSYTAHNRYVHTPQNEEINSAIQTRSRNMDDIVDWQGRYHPERRRICGHSTQQAWRQFKGLAGVKFGEQRCSTAATELFFLQGDTDVVVHDTKHRRLFPNGHRAARPRVCG